MVLVLKTSTNGEKCVDFLGHLIPEMGKET